MHLGHRGRPSRGGSAALGGLVTATGATAAEAATPVIGSTMLALDVRRDADVRGLVGGPPALDVAVNWARLDRDAAHGGAAAQFLCSPGAAYIAGTILPVDGGYLMA